MSRPAEPHASEARRGTAGRADARWAHGPAEERPTLDSSIAFSPQKKSCPLQARACYACSQRELASCRACGRACLEHALGGDLRTISR
eukprot:CAMPEP_0198504236 /NCGR_PEP_ID=MMETSP1462-20131121/10391_1 /TAXON_ID=1333877 /ORGANISM="Brandtodinium nutriculum, Strain RCC3387" /LENGTH=87 /DNA_ID=CAMNT_0044233399 /DNA_START=65 /DNA_END=325 /DNA_ORIENTATION=+